MGSSDRGSSLKYWARIAVAAPAGTVIAWMVTAFLTFARFALGGYTPEAFVEMPLWAFGVIGAGGALLGAVLGMVGGRALLAWWVRPTMYGALAGVVLVVLSTLMIATALGGPSKGQGPYLHAGLVYGVPVGIIVGAFTGLHMGRK